MAIIKLAFVLLFCVLSASVFAQEVEEEDAEDSAEEDAVVVEDAEESPHAKRRKAEIAYYKAKIKALEIEAWSEMKKDKCKGGNDCCEASKKCGIGEGDCDENYQCVGDLVCGTDNCKNKVEFPHRPGDFVEIPDAEFSHTDDCCTFPQHLVEALNNFDPDCDGKRK